MEYREVPLAHASDLRDGEMKEVNVGEARVLLARVRGEFHAVSATCPHYGAPLAEGALCGARVVCPWHHAAFNVTNGDLEEPPALDALVSYGLRVEGEQILVRLPTETRDRRTPAMAGRDTVFDAVPFFWTRQFDAGLLYVGHAPAWDEIIFGGDLPAHDFLAIYVKGGRVAAVAGMNRERELAAAEELLRLGRMPAPDRVRGGAMNLSELLHDTGLSVAEGAAAGLSAV